MIAICLLPVYILVNLYVFWWGIRYMSACSRHFKKTWVRTVIAAAYIFVASSIGIGFLLKPSMPERFFKGLGYYWLGTFLYIILTIVVVDLGRVILKHLKWVNQEKLAFRKTFVLTGTCCIIFIAAVSVYGIFNARNIHVTPYDVKIEKTCKGMDELNIVLVADLHLGYNIGTWQMKQMVKKINAQKPDLVCIAGDIFDNEYEALDDPEQLVKILKSIDSKYGVYACYGNHDVQEKILAGFTFSQEKKKVSDPRMDELLEKADIQLLRDETVLIDDAFYLAGRPDYKKPGRGITQRKTPEELTADLDLTKPVIVMDHQPRELEELADAGVDLDLSGHTHDGQMFPGNLLSALMWENSCGYLKKGDMHNIVTSGVGLFGPNMRVGTKAEVCAIRVRFR